VTPEPGAQSKKCGVCEGTGVYRAHGETKGKKCGLCAGTGYIKTKYKKPKPKGKRK
jgi:hypothetical protein